jgi:CDP-4-dehydro-6-deoxyglucose reductase
MFQIRLKNTSHFSCSPEDTILMGAQKEGVHLNYSCKTGRCKSCKAKLVEGSTLTISEEIGLSQEERKEGYILTCIRKPASDLKLDIEDLSGYSIEPIKIIPSKIESIRKLNQDVIELKLRIPPNTSFPCLAGQFINIIKGDYKKLILGLLYFIDAEINIKRKIITQIIFKVFKRRPTIFRTFTSISL